jgi:hypothetical protein
MNHYPNAVVKVRFYRQEWYGDSPVEGKDSVLIHEVELPAIPAFRSQTHTDEPNWSLASTTLDTNGLGDTYRVFWVLVWAEDQRAASEKDSESGIQNPADRTRGFGGQCRLDSARHGELREADRLERPARCREE